jgi:hypothetical protein
MITGKIIICKTSFCFREKTKGDKRAEGRKVVCLKINKKKKKIIVPFFKRKPAADKPFENIKHQFQRVITAFI